MIRLRVTRLLAIASGDYAVGGISPPPPPPPPPPPIAAAIAVAHGTSPFVSAYPWSAAGFGTKFSDPATRVPNTGNGLTFLG